jgi:hypothetical protein
VTGLVELAPGLHRWTARHPDADPSPTPGSPADWGPDVGCVAYEAPDALVLVDPLVPDDRPDLLDALDALVRRGGRLRRGRRPRIVEIVTTIEFHRRSRDELALRYFTDALDSSRTMFPQGLEAVPIQGAGETIVWIPEHRALVPGDRLLGDDAGGLRLCPESWLRYLPSSMRHPELCEALRPLLDLPVEMVVVSHGEPVLSGGREAIARALER